MGRHQRSKHVAALIGLLAGCAAASAVQARPATERSGIPPFCVMIGGSLGQNSRPQICRYYAYQPCLQAAAALHGNCVVNIDYPGNVDRMTGTAPPADPRW